MNDIKEEGFQVFLREKGLSPATVESYTNYIQHFESWLQDENIALEAVQTKDIFTLLQYWKVQGNSQKTLSFKLCVIKHYFTFLMKNDRYVQLVNPCHNLVIKGIVRSLPSGLLTEQELTAIYQTAPQETPQQMRHKILLGFVIYQAFIISDCCELERSDVKLEEGTVYIRGGRKSNARYLKLLPVQYPILEQYLESFTTKEDLDTYFFARTTKRGFDGFVHFYSKKLKERLPFYRNYHQLRASRIVLWLNQHNLREVQYRAGHRYASSTERYLLRKIEDLQNQLQKHHPRK